MSDYCLTCGGLIPDPGKAYGYAGKFCLCQKEPQICRPASKENIIQPHLDRLKFNADILKERDLWRAEALAARDLIKAMIALDNDSILPIIRKHKAAIDATDEAELK